jgi:hypothetical protein
MAVAETDEEIDPAKVANGFHHTWTAAPRFTDDEAGVTLHHDRLNRRFVISFREDPPQKAIGHVRTGEGQAP